MIKQQLIFTFLLQSQLYGDPQKPRGRLTANLLTLLTFTGLNCTIWKVFFLKAKLNDRTPTSQGTNTCEESPLGRLFLIKSKLQGQPIWALIPENYNKASWGQVLSCLVHFAWLILQGFSLSAGQEQPAGTPVWQVGIQQGRYYELLTCSITTGSNLVCDDTRTVSILKELTLLFLALFSPYNLCPKAMISQDCLGAQTLLAFTLSVACARLQFWQ